MATITDPAYELGEIAARLSEGTNQPGEAFLAQRFGVHPWSTDFVLILACIYQRIDLVSRTIQRDGIDEGVRDTAKKVLDRFRGGFSGSSFRNAWNTGAHGLNAMKDSEHALKMMSHAVRQHVSYPKLTEEEIAEFLELIDAYLIEFRKNTDEPEFVWQAIGEGLTKFQFQLRYLGWMGSGYLLESFRELMYVYGWATQRVRESHELDAGAALKGLGTLLTKFKKTVDTAESWRKSGTAVWQAYQLASGLVVPVLLLTHKGGA